MLYNQGVNQRGDPAKTRRCIRDKQECAIMGFLEQSETKQTPIVILTPGFQVEATLNSVGLMQTFLNDDTKAVFTLTDVTLYGLEQGNPAASVALDELFLRKDECHAVAFPEILPREESGLLPRTELMAAYTSHYVIQGDYHMGSDTFLSDYFDIAKSIFLGVTDAYMFPLFTAQAAVIQQAPLVYVSRRTVKMHHRAG
jgi:hypothetical protein